MSSKGFGIMRVLNSGTLVVIACSTGGPKALKEVIPKLTKEFSTPVIVIQHMPEGFTSSLANSLNDISDIKVKEAVSGEEIISGVCYLAPGGTQIRYDSIGKRPSIAIVHDKRISGLAPCADYFLRSLADSMFERIVVVVLTGMGKDATEGIKALKESKEVYVISQDEKSSTVYGMPRSVVHEGLSDVEASLGDISKEIINYLEVQ